MSVVHGTSWAALLTRRPVLRQASDVHYVKHVAEPAGESPADMVSKTDTTAEIAGKIQCVLCVRGFSPIDIFPVHSSTSQRPRCACTAGW